MSLAACTNQTDMVDFLLTNPYQKVDVREKDSEGNNVLHALVLVADDSPKNTDFFTRMYDHLLKAACLHLKSRRRSEGEEEGDDSHSSSSCNPEGDLEKMENNQGDTPIELAAKTGKLEVIQ